GCQAQRNGKRTRHLFQLFREILCQNSFKEITHRPQQVPGALGHSEAERVNNLWHILDGYFDQGAHHLNVNVFGVDKLRDCMEHPEKPEYANFTIRVSGYAVKFIDLTREQQLDVIARSEHTYL
ncbi:MAG: hypothetical protein IIU98_01480, partial [Ruminococcus sp.]|nr:hypothetical protein [Ruminococcus sp.]